MIDKLPVLLSRMAFTMGPSVQKKAKVLKEHRKGKETATSWRENRDVSATSIPKKAAMVESRCDSNTTAGIGVEDKSKGTPEAILKPPGNDCQATTKTITEENCPSLCRSIERWGLIRPYHNPTSESKWAAYYAERAALEFRHETFFPPGDKAGQELQCYRQCFRSLCKGAAAVPETKDSPPLCMKCKKTVTREGVHCVRYTDDIKEKWATLVRDDPTLASVYCQESEMSFTARRPPFMRPHCTESYAHDCHKSGTPREEYEDLRSRIQERIVETVRTTNLFDDEYERTALGQSLASGLFILDYWIKFEECSVDADVRTVDFTTRLYPPNGSGASIDLCWYRHFRRRCNVDDEKFSSLHVYCRTLEDCDPAKPTHSLLSRSERDKEVAVLGGGKGSRFTRPGKLRNLRLILFGVAGEKNVSLRKVFGLLARASGARVIRKEGSWLFAEMRRRYELYPGEECDGR